MKRNLTRALLFVIALWLQMIACNNTAHNVSESNKQPDSLPIQAKVDVPSAVVEDGSTISYSDSAVILGDTYRAVYKDNDTIYVWNDQQKLIFTAADLYPYFDFYDFNADGLKDIRVQLIASNTPGMQALFLFDRRRKNFFEVEDFREFPDPKSIKGTKYYYSYHKSGCADMNWDSDLFYIDGAKAVCIGNICGRQCNNRDGEDGIYIYKIKNEKKALIKKFSTSVMAGYKEFKWGFIKAYWMKNYSKFIR